LEELLFFREFEVQGCLRDGYDGTVIVSPVTGRGKRDETR
jgi:hypothetical protein